MFKISTLIISSLFTLFFLSCQPIMMKLYGIKDPKEENKVSIVKKAHKFGLDTTNIVTCSFSNFIPTAKKHGIPDASIYDANGEYIEYRISDSACNAGLFEFIPNLKIGNNYNKPDSLNLQGEWKQLRDLNGNILKEPKKADFYVLIYWTVYSGKLNKDHVKIWEKLANENKQCSIEVIKVNMDVQSWWQQDEKEKILGRYKKKK